VAWKEGVLEVSGGHAARLLARWPLHDSAISLGHAIIAQDELALIVSRRHERVHVRQCELFGPFMLPLSAAAPLVALMRGWHPYRGNACERQAQGGVGRMAGWPAQGAARWWRAHAAPAGLLPAVRRPARLTPVSFPALSR